jgi:hypothetical protein
MAQLVCREDMVVALANAGASRSDIFVKVVGFISQLLRFMFLA